MDSQPVSAESATTVTEIGKLGTAGWWRSTSTTICPPLSFTEKMDCENVSLMSVNEK